MIGDYVQIGETWTKNRTDQNEKILSLLRKCKLKQAFRRGEELQMEIILLFNLYSNKLDDFVNNSNKEDVIWRLVRHAIV